MNNYGVKKLASAVILQTVKDLNASGDFLERTEREVMIGGLDIYFDILNIEMPKEEFIRRAKEGNI